MLLIDYKLIDYPGSLSPQFQIAMFIVSYHWKDSKISLYKSSNVLTAIRIFQKPWNFEKLFGFACPTEDFHLIINAIPGMVTK